MVVRVYIYIHNPTHSVWETVNLQSCSPRPSNTPPAVREVQVVCSRNTADHIVQLVQSIVYSLLNIHNDRERKGFRTETPADGA